MDSVVKGLEQQEGNLNETLGGRLPKKTSAKRPLKAAQGAEAFGNQK